MLQQNVFSRTQAIRCGASDDLIARRLKAGLWVHEAPGVYGLPGPHSFERRLWVGHLAAGEDSMASHESAASLHHFQGSPPNRVILIGQHSGWARIPNVFVHQINDVLPHHRTTISRLPVTTPDRTVVDLAAVWGAARLAEVLDDQVTKRRLTYVAVGRVLREVARRGKPGVRKLTAILDVRGPEFVPTASAAEARLLEGLEAAGEPEPRRQFPFPGRQFTTGCVDFAYVDARLIIEVDSRSWHTRISDIKRDHHRDAEAGAHGWYTHRVLAEDLERDLEGEIRIIREIRRSRLAQLGAHRPNSTQ